VGCTRRLLGGSARLTETKRPYYLPVSGKLKSFSKQLKRSTRLTSALVRQVFSQEESKINIVLDGGALGIHIFITANHRPN
jgi:hypothetical protein